jgi:twitching motility protein PilT
MRLNDLLTFSVDQNASDLHLSSGMPPLIRVDGDLNLLAHPTLDHEDILELLHGVMDDDQRKAYEDRLECDFAIEIPQLARFRVNAFRQHRGAGAVFRTIPTQIKTLEELNCPPIFREIVNVPRGLVLVTGPTGSGKSTTLAALIDYKNRTEHGHILTIEDPVEFIHPSRNCLVNQRQVHRDTLSFSAALRSALREDPDVILVGELRDLETIRLALTAAETGHLVFATLHTSSAPKTIDRIIDVFPAAEKSLVRSMLSESLRAVIAQTLLKRSQGGRTPAWEIMVGVPAIRNLIREDKIAQMVSAIQTGQTHGMQTLDQHLKKLVNQGLVSREEALSKAQHKSSFQ